MIRPALPALWCYEIRFGSLIVCHLAGGGTKASAPANTLPDDGQGGIGSPPSATNTLPVWGHGGMGRPPSASKCGAGKLAVGKVADICLGLRSIAITKTARLATTITLSVVFTELSPYLVMCVAVWLRHAA